MKRRTRYLWVFGGVVGGGLLMWTGHASASHDARTLHTCVSQQVIRAAETCRPAENAVVLVQEAALTDIQARFAALESRVADLETDNTALTSRVADLETDNTALTGRLVALETLLAGVTRTGDELMFTGMNLNLRNGLDRTDSSNGLGNLIVGYNEGGGEGGARRAGSHNLVVGPYHDYRSHGGVVFGRRNIVAGEYSTVTGGSDNLAYGGISSVSGGESNLAFGHASSVSGGHERTPFGDHDWWGGGLHQDY